jgi:hypothetical protein
VVETPTLKAVESVITINGLKFRGNSIPVTLVGAFRMCSVLELGGTEWDGSIPRAWNGSDPVFGSEKNEERNGFIPVFGFGMG